VPDQTLTIESGDLCDLDDNGIVDGLDIMIMIDKWGQTRSFADVNGDDVVNVFDLLILLRNLG
jgi:hypothetical protein